MTSQAVTLPPGTIDPEHDRRHLRVAGSRLELVAERRQRVVAHGIHAAVILVDKKPVHVDERDPCARSLRLAGPDHRGRHLSRIGGRRQLDIERTPAASHRPPRWRSRPLERSPPPERRVRTRPVRSKPTEASRTSRYRPQTLPISPHPNIMAPRLPSQSSSPAGLIAVRRQSSKLFFTIDSRCRQTCPQHHYIRKDSSHDHERNLAGRSPGGPDSDRAGSRTELGLRPGARPGTRIRWPESRAPRASPGRRPGISRPARRLARSRRLGSRARRPAARLGHGAVHHQGARREDDRRDHPDSRRLVRRLRRPETGRLRPGSRAHRPEGNRGGQHVVSDAPLEGRRPSSRSE